MSNDTLERLDPAAILPTSILRPQPNLLPFIADYHLAYLLPIVIYWAIGLTFHVFDTYGWFSQYKTHTPAEFLKRNHATLSKVLKYAIIQQIAQCIFGWVLSGGPELVHSHEYNIVKWVQTVRSVRSKVISSDGYGHTALWELALAETLYWFLIPTVRLSVALFLSDTWQYFTHRLLHQNKWLYSMLDLNRSHQDSWQVLTSKWNRACPRCPPRDPCQLRLWGLLQPPGRDDHH